MPDAGSILKKIVRDPAFVVAITLPTKRPVAHFALLCHCRCAVLTFGTVSMLNCIALLLLSLFYF